MFLVTYSFSGVLRPERFYKEQKINGKDVNKYFNIIIKQQEDYLCRFLGTCLVF